MVHEMTKKDTGMFSYHPFVYKVIDDVIYNRRECKSMFGKIVELYSDTEWFRFDESQNQNLPAMKW